MRYFSSVVAVFTKYIFAKKGAVSTTLYISGSTIALVGIFYFAQIQLALVQYEFFSKMLANIPAREIVVIRDEEFIISKGKVYDVNAVEIAPNKSVPALKLAYAKAQARYEPPISLAGTNLTEFYQSIEDLIATSKALSSTQKNTRDKEYIEQYLYPIAYLKAVLDTETKRRAFITSGSEEDFQAYQKSLYTLTRSLRNNVYTFQHTFIKVVPADAPDYITARRIISRDGILSGIHDILERNKYLSSKIRTLQNCISGRVTFCTPIKTYQLTTIENNFVPTEDEYAVAENVFDFQQETGFEITTPIFFLSKSECLDPEITPPFYALPHTILHDSEIAVIGNMRFVQSSEQDTIPFFSYMQNEGIEYVPSREKYHYTCAHYDADMGILFTLKNIYDAIQFSPLSELANTADSRIALQAIEKRVSGSKFVSEKELLGYINEAHTIIEQGHMSEIGVYAVADLSLQAQHRTGRYDWIPGSIAKEERINTEISYEGVPTQVTTAHLFFTRSGIFPLLLFSNTSLGFLDSSFDISNVLQKDTPYLYLSSLLENSPDLYPEIVEDNIKYRELHHSNTP